MSLPNFRNTWNSEQKIPVQGRNTSDRLNRRTPRLFRESPNAEGNREPDHDHVYEQPLNQVMKVVRASCVKRGEGQNDKIHYFFNCGAKEQTAHQWMLLQET